MPLSLLLEQKLHEPNWYFIISNGSALLVKRVTELVLLSYIRYTVYYVLNFEATIFCLLCVSSSASRRRFGEILFSTSSLSSKLSPFVFTLVPALSDPVPFRCHCAVSNMCWVIFQKTPKPQWKCSDISFTMSILSLPLSHSLPLSPSLWILISLSRPSIAHFRWFSFCLWPNFHSSYHRIHVANFGTLHETHIHTIQIHSVGAFPAFVLCGIFMRSKSVPAYRRYSQKFTETWNEADITVHSKPHAIYAPDDKRQRNFTVSTPKLFPSISNKLIRRHRWSQAKPSQTNDEEEIWKPRQQPKWT